jgi:hypothetical protein
MPTEAVGQGRRQHVSHHPGQVEVNRLTTFRMVRQMVGQSEDLPVQVARLMAP